MRFNPSKLQTNFLYPMTPSGPVKGRKYTLTHSDTTGMMFLDIGEYYNYSAINQKLRDELLGKWQQSDDDSYKLIFYAYICDSDFTTSSFKYSAFKYHLNSALQTVIYGDRYLFEKYTNLINTPIYVKFDSNIPMFDNYEFYGYVKDYII